MKQNETRFIVRYAETDQMGIVHHSNYAVWFEAGRTDFLKNIGFSYGKIEEIGAMLPLIELKCSFKNAAKYEDEIIVKTSLKESTNTRMTFSYEVYKEGSDKVLSHGETVHVWTDLNLKPVNIKKFKPQIYELISSLL